MKKDIDYLIELLQRIKENDELIDEILSKFNTSSAKANRNKKLKGGGK